MIEQILDLLEESLRGRCDKWAAGMREVRQLLADGRPIYIRPLQGNPTCIGWSEKPPKGERAWVVILRKNE